jgi:site-specific recombinase XerC
VPDAETRVLRAEEIARLLKVCEGRDFTERRDMAVVSLLLDTGIRRAELAGLNVDHVSVADREAYVMGKGRRARIAPFGHRTAKALDRYLLLREAHRRADLPALWLAERGGGLTAYRSSAPTALSDGGITPANVG